MNNRQIAAAFRDLFSWWKRWQDAASDAELNQASAEGFSLVRKYADNNQPDEFVVNAYRNLMHILENRQKTDAKNMRNTREGP